MLFNSIDFAVFLPIVFFVYWFVANKNLRLQNLFIVAASYLFYGWWDWRILVPIIISTVMDYQVGRLLLNETSHAKRKLLLFSSIATNLGLLFYFKYYNFFVGNFVAAFTFLGVHIDASPLYIILPIGISFYTLQTLSYSIDVYKQKLQPTTDFVAFSAFVCFFPQLVAGPIERATNLLPQFFRKRIFDEKKSIDGLRQILWGLFKKIVIADHCAVIVDDIFKYHWYYSGSSLLLGAVLFAFQIYCDFSGYSDIAIGTARLFGFELKQNFAFPYFSRNIAEFWKRWHISLSSWFKDYVYIPLGGNRVNIWMQIINIFVVFILSGLWHGAQWKYMVWGLLNAIYFIPMVFYQKQIKTEVIPNRLPSLKDFFKITVTFLLIVFAWIFFRANNLPEAIMMVRKICSPSLFHPLNFTSLKFSNFLFLPLLLVFIGIEWHGRGAQYALENIGLGWKRVFRWSFYISLIICLFFFSSHHREFIYFRF